MKAYKRLRVIADLIKEPKKTVADIGADHGYLSKMLIEENRAEKVIATDISAKSLEKTAILAKKYLISNKILTKVGDGLKPLKVGEAQIVVIAGMGGYEIIKILQDNKDNKIEQFIFQPVQNVVELRKFLNENNYEILQDFIVKDKDKFYNTIVAKFGSGLKLNDYEIEFGLSNIKNPNEDFLEYLNIYIEKYKKLVSKNVNVFENEKKIKTAYEILKRK